MAPSGNCNRNMQKKQASKMAKKLRRLQNRKKLKRHVINAIKDIKGKRHAASRQRLLNIEKDWVLDRQVVAANEADDDILPLDMVDADIDWENSAFASKIKRIRNAKNKADITDIESEPRKFAGTLDDNMRELLPIKMGKKVVRQIRVEDNDSKSEEFVEKPEENEESHVDLSKLSAAALLKLRHDHVEEAKSRISNLAFTILADPQDEAHKLKELYLLSTGEGIFSLARETVMKLAIASLAEIFVDIIPGYVIRPRTKEEMGQKLKKETKKLYDFEDTLLRYYLKYLQHLEKYAGRLLKSSQNMKDDQLPFVCLKCFSRLLISVPHFNHTSNIITLLVRIATSTSEQAVSLCCTTLSELFHNDHNFRISAMGTKSIASIVKQKKGNVTPSLIATFLKLNIKEVNKDEKNQRKERLLNKKWLIKKEKKIKSKQKIAKQLKKLEADLKETEAAESISTKLSFATETMNYVFATYFRVLKRLPTTNLLEPVLEGLAKFAHLINIEFFDDVISVLSSLVNQQHLRLIDSLRCIYTAFVILSGEGIALNIDPSRFYWLMYRLLPALAFEKQPDRFADTLAITLRTLDLMINSRRKQVPLCRVAAFAKRLLAVTFFVPPSAAASILLCVRSFFIAYPKLDCLVEDSDGTSYTESFKPEVEDPDCCGALSSSIIAETKILTRHTNQTVAMIARYLHAGLPSTGQFRLLPQYSTRKAYDWYEQNNKFRNEEEEPCFTRQITAFVKKQKMQLTSKTLHSLICKWIDINMANI